MSVPTAITTELADLQAQVTAAQPLAQASQATVTAIKMNAATLVAAIDTAINAATGKLDTWAAPVDPLTIIAGIQAVAVNADDQADLTNMRGFVGRATSNLNQVA
jgi:hypothetical protein